MAGQDSGTLWAIEEYTYALCSPNGPNSTRIELHGPGTLRPGGADFDQDLGGAAGCKGLENSGDRDNTVKGIQITGAI